MAGRACLAAALPWKLLLTLFHPIAPLAPIFRAAVMGGDPGEIDGKKDGQGRRGGPLPPCAASATRHPAPSERCLKTRTVSYSHEGELVGGYGYPQGHPVVGVV